MQRILNYILGNRNTILYLFLLLISLALTFNARSYHQSKAFNSSRWITGTTYEVSNSITSYFNLGEVNKNLIEENRRLRKQLFNIQELPENKLDSNNLGFEIKTAKVVKNSFSSPRNYITINKGRKQGIAQDMGVITHIGILGIVENVSTNYATVQSVLNTNSRINAKIKNTNYFGSLEWDGRNYQEVQLIDIPRSVPLVVGDTIVTGGMSSIFPENIPIGVIKKYSLNQSQSLFTITVGLFNDMANLNTAYIISKKDRQEQLDLENQTTNANQ